MSRPLLLILAASIVLCTSCAPKADPEWSQFLVDQTVLVFWGLGPSGSNLRTEIGELVGQSLDHERVMGSSVTVEPVATALFPEGVDQLKAVWIFRATSFPDSDMKLAGWTRRSNYTIDEGDIALYEQGAATLATSRFKDWILVSTSTHAIELALRAASGTVERMTVENKAGLHVNAAEFGRLFASMAAPAYRASLAGAFRGLGVVHLSLDQTSEQGDWILDIPVSLPASKLVHYLASGTTEREAWLDVPSGVAFAMFWNDPLGDTRYDSLRAANGYDTSARSLVESFSDQVGPELALFVSEAPSSQVAFVRRASGDGVSDLLEELYGRGVLDRDGGLYVGQDPMLARTLCSGLCPLSRYAIGLHNQKIILSSSETLVRTLMAGDGTPPRSDPRFPEPPGTNSAKEGSYGWGMLPSIIQVAKQNGWMDADQTVPAMLRRFSSLGYRVYLEGGRLKLHVRMDPESVSGQQDQVVLAWQYPLEGDTLTTKPLITTLNGRTAVVATMSSGRVVALSSSGDVLFDVSTLSEPPIGSALAYDWYSNRSPVVIQAAGASIYGWSPSGNLLPGFPFVLDAAISAPIVITDVEGNAEPEVLAATMDQRLHLINRDGRGVAGWPVFTKGYVQDAPIAQRIDGVWSVEINKDAGAETFDRLGRSVPNRPREVDASIPPDSAEIQLDLHPFQNKAPFQYGQFAVVADLDDDGVEELVVVLDGQLRCYRLPTDPDNR